MPDYKHLPDELTHLPQWVCVRNGSKIPMCPWENKSASSTDPETWSDFETALESVANRNYDYLGFVFADNGLVGIDIDCGYDEDGFISDIANDIIGICNSYTEKSRSGRGFHILLRGTLPFKGKNNLTGVEIYKSSRYFIMTGDVFSHRELVENQRAIEYVLDKYFPNSKHTENTYVPGKSNIYQPIWKDPVVEKRIALRPIYPTISEGGRNISLTSFAGSLHNMGYGKRVIYRELQYLNSIACYPPLDLSELGTICNSVTRYDR